MRSKTDEPGSRALNRFRAEDEEIYLVTRDRFLSGPYFYLELGTDSSLVHQNLDPKATAFGPRFWWNILDFARNYFENE